MVTQIKQAPPWKKRSRPFTRLRGRTKKSLGKTLIRPCVYHEHHQAFFYINRTPLRSTRSRSILQSWASRPKLDMRLILAWALFLAGGKNFEKVNFPVTILKVFLVRSLDPFFRGERTGNYEGARVLIKSRRAQKSWITYLNIKYPRPAERIGYRSR